MTPGSVSSLPARRGRSTRLGALFLNLPVLGSKEPEQERSRISLKPSTRPLCTNKHTPETRLCIGIFVFFLSSMFICEFTVFFLIQLVYLLKSYITFNYIFVCYFELYFHVHYFPFFRGRGREQSFDISQQFVCLYFFKWLRLFTFPPWTYPLITNLFYSIFCWNAAPFPNTLRIISFVILWIWKNICDITCSHDVVLNRENFRNPNIFVLLTVKRKHD